MEPQAKQEFTLSDLLYCVAREVAMRKACYPKWDKVTSLDELSPSRKRELAMMEAVGAMLTNQSELLASMGDTNRVLAERLAAQPAPVDDALLAELAQLEAIATPGPWLYKPEWLDWVIGVQDTRPGYTDDTLRIAERACYQPADRQQANFSLIVGLRNALPALLARVQQAEAPRTLTPREQQAIANINAVLAGDGSDPESGPGAWGDCGEVDVPVLLDAIRRLTTGKEATNG